MPIIEDRSDSNILHYPRKDKTHYRHREEEVAFAHCHGMIQRLEYINEIANVTYV